MVRMMVRKVVILVLILLVGLSVVGYFAIFRNTKRFAAPGVQLRQSLIPIPSGGLNLDSIAKPLQPGFSDPKTNMQWEYHIPTYQFLSGTYRLRGSGPVAGKRVLSV